jgi:hypothetical protein
MYKALRESIIVCLAVLGLACSAGSPRSDRSGDASARAVASRGPRTTLDSVIESISRKIAPLDSALQSVPAALRPDSGSAVSDSVLLVLQAALAHQTYAVTKTFDDSAFQVLAWPEGVRGDQVHPAPDSLVANSIRHYLLDHGIWSYMAEGDGYFDLSLARLRSIASPFVTEAAREALRIEAFEQESPFAGDAAVGIPWDSLGDRIAVTDRFLVAFPNARARASIEGLRGSYLLGFLTGFDNTQVFDHVTQVLDPAIRRSYERFLVVHGSTATARVIRSYLELLAKTRYRRTPAVERFLHCEPELRDTGCGR